MAPPYCYHHRQYFPQYCNQTGPVLEKQFQSETATTEYLTAFHFHHPKAEKGELLQLRGRDFCDVQWILAFKNVIRYTESSSLQKRKRTTSRKVNELSYGGSEYRVRIPERTGYG